MQNKVEFCAGNDWVELVAGVAECEVKDVNRVEWRMPFWPIEIISSKGNFCKIILKYRIFLLKSLKFLKSK